MARILSEDEFLSALRTFSRSAFRLETRDSYAMDYERENFERFLAGSPVPPPEVGWWKGWLDRVAQLGREGKTVSRVRVLAEPPTDYQRWLLWAAPWYAEAGEDIRYISRSRAARAGLPLSDDWWLLDDTQVIVMRFTDEGAADGKMLVTDPDLVARYRAWRSIAVRNAVPAESVAAA